MLIVVMILLPAFGFHAAAATNNALSDSGSPLTFMADGPFKLLQGNDTDAALNHTNKQPKPVDLGITSWTDTQSKWMATRTDAFRRNLDRKIFIAWKDNWIRQDDRTDWSQLQYRILYGELDIPPEKAKALYWEEILTSDNIPNETFYAVAHKEPRNGWLPVRDADIVNNSGEIEMADPYTEVNIGRYMSYRERNKRGAKSFAVNGKYTSRIPMGNRSWLSLYHGNYTYTTTGNGVLPSREFPWGTDHWTGVGSVRPGYRYNGSFVIKNRSKITVVSPSDFRLYKIPDLETNVTKTCLIPDGPDDDSFGEEKQVKLHINSTWEISNVSVNHTVISGDGKVVGGQGQTHYAVPQAYNRIKNIHTLNVTLEHHLTIFSYNPNCTSYDTDKTEKIVQKRTVKSEADLSASKGGASVTVYAVEKPAEEGTWEGNEIAIRIEGDYTLGGMPLAKIRLKYNSTWTRQRRGPWRAYPKALYKRAKQYRTGGGTKIVRGSWKQPVPFGKIPHMYRDVPGRGEWKTKASNFFVVVTESNSSGNITRTYTSDNYKPTPNKTKVIRMLRGNTNLTDKQLKQITAKSKSMFNTNLPTTVRHVTYRNSTLNATLAYTKDGNAFYELCLSSNGNPVSGKKLNLTGANESTVVTDSNGCAIANATGLVLIAEFEETDLFSNAGSYYVGSTVRKINPAALYGGTRSVVDRIATMIGMLIMYAAWIPILLVGIWFKITHPKRL